LAIGGPNDNAAIGATWIYTRSGNTSPFMLQNKLVGTVTSNPGRQGSSVSLRSDGNVLAIGAPADNSGIGSAITFARTDNSQLFVPPGNLLINPSTMPVLLAQGRSVSLSADGQTLAVGATQTNGRTGAVSIFIV